VGHWNPVNGQVMSQTRHVEPGSSRRSRTATYTVGLFVVALRGRGLGQEITRLVLAWAFGVLGVHRVELEVLAGNGRAIGCYRACGFGQEGIRHEAEVQGNPGVAQPFVRDKFPEFTPGRLPTVRATMLPSSNFLGGRSA
jgi:RimJ/RimL family protein N-acetyltransferase